MLVLNVLILKKISAPERSQINENWLIFKETESMKRMKIRQSIFATCRGEEKHVREISNNNIKIHVDRDQVLTLKVKSSKPCKSQLYDSENLLTWTPTLQMSRKCTMGIFMGIMGIKERKNDIYKIKLLMSSHTPQRI